MDIVVVVVNASTGRLRHSHALTHAPLVVTQTLALLYLRHLAAAAAAAAEAVVYDTAQVQVPAAAAFPFIQEASATKSQSNH